MADEYYPPEDASMNQEKQVRCCTILFSERTLRPEVEHGGLEFGPECDLE